MEETKDSYFMVHSFMTSGLKLSGTELLTFALIYSFACSEERCFHGSLKYIAEHIGTTKRSVTNAIKSLTEKKLIERNESNNDTYPSYVIVESVLKQNSARKSTTEEVNFFHPPEEKFSSPPGKNFTTPTKNFHPNEEKFSPNNKEDNKYYNKADNSAHGGARGEANKNFNGNGGYNGGYYGKGNKGGNKGGYYSKKGWCTYDDGRDAAYWDDVFAYVLARSEEDDDDEVVENKSEETANPLADS